MVKSANISGNNQQKFNAKNQLIFEENQKPAAIHPA